MQNYSKPALLALEDGSLFYGTAIGVAGITVGEVVFNTGMTGYQEVLTDASYCHQLITFTSPHIGNTGINLEDNESSDMKASGIIIRQLSPYASNWRAKLSLQNYLIKNNKIGIAGIDTRKLTRHLSKHGVLKGCIMTQTIDEQQAVKFAQCFSFPKQNLLINKISTAKIYQWQPKNHLIKNKLHIVVYDFGVKHGILQLLKDRHCFITVVPAITPLSEVLALCPDGIVLSNGPGDPNDYAEGIKLAKSCMNHAIPLLGICLGHQLIGLAAGAKIIKMKQGHHGINHPVMNIQNKQVFITSQNHNFTLDENTLPADFKVTHISLFDKTVQGIKHVNQPIMSVQGHPEAHPGPREFQKIFDEFLQEINCNFSYITQKLLHGTT